jgi:hypothetical protein
MCWVLKVERVREAGRRLILGDGRTFRGGEVISGGEKLKIHFMFFAQSKFYLGQKSRTPCTELLAETKFVKNKF